MKKAITKMNRSKLFVDLDFFAIEEFRSTTSRYTHDMMMTILEANNSNGLGPK